MTANVDQKAENRRSDQEKVTKKLIAVKKMEDQTRQALKILAEAHAAINAGDLVALRNCSAALKGLITSLLANQAFEVASSLESTLREEDLERARDACRRLREALAALHEAGAECLGSIDTPK